MEVDEKELKEVRVIRWWKWTFMVLAKFGSGRASGMITK